MKTYTLAMLNQRKIDGFNLILLLFFISKGKKGGIEITNIIPQAVVLLICCNKEKLSIITIKKLGISKYKMYIQHMKKVSDTTLVITPPICVIDSLSFIH